MANHSRKRNNDHLFRVYRNGGRHCCHGIHEHSGRKPNCRRRRFILSFPSNNFVRCCHSILISFITFLKPFVEPFSYIIIYSCFRLPARVRKRNNLLRIDVYKRQVLKQPNFVWKVRPKISVLPKVPGIRN